MASRKRVAVTTSHSGWATQTVTRSREDYTGFDDIAICRPRFIFFKVTGLRPNTRHFAFFDKINVTDYVNVDSFTFAQRETLSRNSVLANPGDTYKTATEFPAEQGGKSAVIRSDDAGEIEGCFYLQSNETLNFPAGNRQLVFLDISAYNPNDAISIATANFTVDGGVENYLKEYYTTTQRYWATWTTTSYVYVDPPANISPRVEDHVVPVVKKTSTKEVATKKKKSNIIKTIAKGVTNAVKSVAKGVTKIAKKIFKVFGF